MASAIWTYVCNTDPRDQTGSIFVGGRYIKIGQYAELTPEEVAQIKANGRYVLEEGVIEPGGSRAETETSYAVLGTDGTVGGPGGSPLLPSVVISSTAASVLQQIIGAGDPTDFGLFSPVTLPARPETRELLALSANSTLASGHGWKFGGTEGASNNLNYTSDNGLSGQCIRLSSNGKGAASWVQLTRFAEMNLTGKFLRFFLKIPADSAANLNALEVFVGSGAAAFESKLNQGILNTYGSEGPLHAHIKPDEWVAVTLQPSGFAGLAGTPDWTKVQDLRIAISDENKANAPAEILFGGVEIVSNDARFPNGVVSFAFADSITSAATIAAPYLAKYGYQATANIVGEWIGTLGHMTLAQLEHLQRVNGWDIACHSWSGTLTSNAEGLASLTTKEIIEEWDLLKGWLHAHGLDSPYHGAYPQGKYNASILALARQKFGSMLTVNKKGSETVPPADRYRLRTQQVVNTTIMTPDSTVNSLEWIIKKASEAGGWIIINIHDIAATAPTEQQITIADFEAIVDYVHAKGVPVYKISEVLGM